MKIRRAKRGDLKKYIELRKEWDKEYSIISSQKLKSTDKQIRKEFNKIIKNKKRFLLVVMKNEKMLGFLIASFFSNNYGKFVYIDDVFIIKKHRGEKLGTQLIKISFEIARKKGIKSIRLGVNIKNKKAIKLYKRLGFKLTHYEMDLKLK